MKSWKIPVVYEMSGIIEVEANTMEEAMEIAKDTNGVIPLPKDASYLDDSWQLSTDDAEYVRQCYNDNQKDEE